MTILGISTDKGRVKKVDQDACCFLEALYEGSEVSMAVICDGVGGLDKGELASATVVRRFATWFEMSLPTFLEVNASDPDVAFERLRSIWNGLIQEANRDIYAYGSSENVALGTTLTALFAMADRYLVAHVGDCRAYEVTEQAATQLTNDQTLVARRVAAGLLAPEEASRHPKRNVILQSVGTQDEVDPEFTEGLFDPDAVYVLCCDGFYGKLRNDELYDSFRPSAASSGDWLQAMCEELVSRDMERGEKDNITVLAFARRSSRKDAGIRAEVCATSASDPARSSVVGVLHAEESEADTSPTEWEEDESPTDIVDSDESPTVISIPREGGEA